MDIHKPKAAHSWREFLIEIGTITIGILIALGLEAALEAWHHHELVEHARADLREELIENRSTLVDTLAVQTKAIDELERVAAMDRERLAGKHPALAKGHELSNTFSSMNTAAWDNTVATQALSYMSYEDARSLGHAYSGAVAFNAFQDEARKAWFQLSDASASDDMTTLELRENLRTVRFNESYTKAAVGAGRDLLKMYDAALKRIE